MTTLTNVFAIHTEATGTMYAGPTNLAGYQCLSGGTAGEVILRDGGASGDILLQFNLPSATIAPFSTLIPGNGIRFTTDIHVTLPGTAKLTIFCG